MLAMVALAAAPAETTTALLRRVLVGVTLAAVRVGIQQVVGLVALPSTHNIANSALVAFRARMPGMD